MVLNLYVTQSDDGFTAEVPSLKGCESWAHTEDEAIEKTIELLKYYLKADNSLKISIDRANKKHPLTIYKLIFEKEK